MRDPVTKLVELGSHPLGGSAFHGVADTWGTRGREVQQLLHWKNGFYCFESALHVFPTGEADVLTIEQWNTPSLWVDAYGHMASGCYFFAEDVFGNQFCINNNVICSFDAETGELEQVAVDLKEWASLILKEYDVLTGYPLGHEWQEVNGALTPDHRLVPKIPFVVGGEFEVSNLYAIEAVRGMRFRGELACQIRDLPDGSPIQFEIVP